MKYSNRFGQHPQDLYAVHTHTHIDTSSTYVAFVLRVHLWHFNQITRQTDSQAGRVHDYPLHWLPLVLLLLPLLPLYIFLLLLLLTCLCFSLLYSTQLSLSLFLCLLVPPLKTLPVSLFHTLAVYLFCTLSLRQNSKHKMAKVLQDSPHCPAHLFAFSPLLLEADLRHRLLRILCVLWRRS